MFLFLSIISSIVPQDLFNINKGYSSLWLIFLYLIGAFIKKIDNKEYLPKNFLYFSLAICLFYSLVIFSNRNTLFNRFQKQILAYNNPLCFISSLYIFKIFKDINIRNPQISKGINIIGAASFSVYLIHAHPLIIRHVISGNCKNISLFMLLPFSLCIFLLCVGIDLLRKQQFILFKISKISFFIQELIESCLSKYTTIKDE
jgi:peptidoglycan/LPS O-acetylase OafA/YrhL